MTSGYTHHPQLIRFRLHPQPIVAIGALLTGIAEEANRRGYQFDVAKILNSGRGDRIEETEGQLLFEWIHLQKKLEKRAPALYQQFKNIKIPEPHPLFRIVPGKIRWEKF